MYLIIFAAAFSVIIFISLMHHSKKYKLKIHIENIRIRNTVNHAYIVAVGLSSNPSNINGSLQNFNNTIKQKNIGKSIIREILKITLTISYLSKALSACHSTGASALFICQKEKINPLFYAC